VSITDSQPVTAGACCICVWTYSRVIC